MALKHLDLSEMVGLTGAWVGTHRPLLLAIPETAAWVPRLDEVHARVVKAQPTRNTEMDAKVVEINAQQAVIDDRHDDFIRGTSHILEGEQYLCRASDPPRLERAALCERARNTLLPEKLAVINTLYVAEAGTAARTRQLITSEAWLRDLLASIPTSDGGTLLKAVESWCSLGVQLGQLEEQKAAVQASIAGTPQPPRPEMIAARGAWLALVNLMLQTFEMVEGHAQAIQTLKAPIVRTAEVAARRYASRGDGETETPVTPDAPAPTGGTAGAGGAGGTTGPVEPGLPGAKPFA